CHCKWLNLILIKVN
ncbi:bacterial regulatory helix-turn-helix, lysR family protein, partial [Vibrio cholerae HC-50A2]